MADQSNEFDAMNENILPPDGDTPVERGDVQAVPRRTASAEFVVKTEIGSDVALREAMDPANQSLTEALRLSYRILQVVMIGLVIAFLLSGFKRVAENQSGVRTQFGKVISADATSALAPGPKFNWPYPIGEFVLFDVQNRSVTLQESYFVVGRGQVVRDTFWPGIRAGEDFAQAVARASENDRLRPGRDGHLVIEDGGVAHIRGSVTYEIEDPVQFLNNVKGKGTGPDADLLVKLSMQRAAIHVAARSSLREFADNDPVLQGDIETMTQSLLDDLHTGIELTNVSIPETTAPLSIRKTLDELAEAKNTAGATVEDAQKQAVQILTRAAGQAFPQLINMISQYENALENGNEESAAVLLDEINAFMDGDEVAGEVANVIRKAEGYRDQVDKTLGSESRRFATLLPAYREHPELVTRQLWWDARASVLEIPDAEIFYVPPGMGHMALRILGSDKVQEIRRRARVGQEDAAAQLGQYRAVDNRTAGLQRAADVNLDGPGRQLDVNAQGEVTAKTNQ